MAQRHTSTHTHVYHHKRPSMGLAIAALLINVLLLPGVGSMIGGRVADGVIQLTLFIIGLVLSLFFIGIPIVIAAWIWALVTGIQIVQEAEQ